MVTAVIFDFFGVLNTDALTAMVDGLRESQPKVADEVVAVVQAANRGQVSRQESSERVAELLGVSVDEYVDRIRKGEAKNQPLLDYVIELRKQYKTALLSNVSIGGLAVRFAPSEMEQYFDTVVASSDVGYAKPDPRVYQLTADRLGVQPNECVFIDDNQGHCAGAEAAGMQAIHYRSNEQLLSELSKLLSR